MISCKSLLALHALTVLPSQQDQTHLLSFFAGAQQAMPFFSMISLNEIRFLSILSFRLAISWLENSSCFWVLNSPMSTFSLAVPMLCAIELEQITANENTRSLLITYQLYAYSSSDFRLLRFKTNLTMVDCVVLILHVGSWFSKNDQVIYTQQLAHFVRPAFLKSFYFQIYSFMNFFPEAIHSERSVNAKPWKNHNNRQ